LKSGSLNLLEPSGPAQACTGIALTFIGCKLPDDDMKKVETFRSVDYIKRDYCNIYIYDINCAFSVIMNNNNRCTVHVSK
jgi:hypothetical protein